MFGVQFYPTPDWLIDKMLSLVKWDKVKYGLEPSAYLEPEEKIGCHLHTEESHTLI